MKYLASSLDKSSLGPLVGPGLLPLGKQTMSMNLHVEAVVIAKSHIGDHRVRKTFELWQTPTKVTTKLLSYRTNSEIIKAYEAWCNRSDPSCFYSLEHIKMLKQWLEDHKEWDIEFYEM